MTYFKQEVDDYCQSIGRKIQSAFIEFNYWKAAERRSSRSVKTLSKVNKSLRHIVGDLNNLILTGESFRHSRKFSDARFPKHFDVLEDGVLGFVESRIDSLHRDESDSQVLIRERVVHYERKMMLLQEQLFRAVEIKKINDELVHPSDLGFEQRFTRTRRLDMQITFLNLSLRAENFLIRSDVIRIRELVVKSREELINLQVSNEKVISEIEEVLNELGLSLSMELPRTERLYVPWAV